MQPDLLAVASLAVTTDMPLLFQPAANSLGIAKANVAPAAATSSGNPLSARLPEGISLLSQLFPQIQPGETTEQIVSEAVAGKRSWAHAFPQDLTPVPSLSQMPGRNPVWNSTNCSLASASAQTASADLSRLMCPTMQAPAYQSASTPALASLLSSLAVQSDPTAFLPVLDSLRHNASLVNMSNAAGSPAVQLISAAAALSHAFSPPGLTQPAPAVVSSAPALFRPAATGRAVALSAIGSYLPPETRLKKAKVKIIQPISQEWEADALRALKNAKPRRDICGERLEALPQLLANSLPGASEVCRELKLFPAGGPSVSSLLGATGKSPTIVAVTSPAEMRNGSVLADSALHPQDQIEQRIPARPTNVPAGSSKEQGDCSNSTPSNPGHDSVPHSSKSTHGTCAGLGEPFTTCEATEGSPADQGDESNTLQLAQVHGQLQMLYQWYVSNRSVYLDQANKLLMMLEQSQQAHSKAQGSGADAHEDKALGSLSNNDAAAADSPALRRAIEKAIHIICASSEVESTWKLGGCRQQAFAGNRNEVTSPVPPTGTRTTGHGTDIHGQTLATS